jgi:putative protein-disulfide isomerase
MRYLIITLLTLKSILSMAQLSEEKPELYYVYDPLCGWCYGFSPVMHQVKDHYKDRVDIEVISGGMVLGDRVGPLSQIAPYIRDGVKRVEDMTGVKFGQSYLDDLFGEGKRIMDSWPPCLALTVFKSFAPSQALNFASDIQRAIYFDGLPCGDMENYARLAARYGVNEEEYLSRCQDDAYGLMTRQEFQFAQDLKAQGYPYVVFKNKGKYFLVAHGYTDFETVKSRLDKMWTE